MTQQTEDTAPHCPKCGAEIHSLEAYSLEENRQIVTLGGFEDLELSESDTIEGSCNKIDFECPECQETIYTNDGDSTDQAVIDFLSGKAPLPPSKPKFLYVFVEVENNLVSGSRVFYDKIKAIKHAETFTEPWGTENVETYDTHPEHMIWLNQPWENDCTNHCAIFEVTPEA